MNEIQVIEIQNFFLQRETVLNYFGNFEMNDKLLNSEAEKSKTSVYLYLKQFSNLFYHITTIECLRLRNLKMYCQNNLQFFVFFKIYNIILILNA